MHHDMEDPSRREYRYLQHDRHFPSTSEEQLSSMEYHPSLSPNQHYYTSHQAEDNSYQHYDAMQNMDHLKSPTNHISPQEIMRPPPSQISSLMMFGHASDGSKRESLLTQQSNRGATDMNTMQSYFTPTPHSKETHLDAPSHPYSTIAENHKNTSPCFSSYFGNPNSHSEMLQSSLNQFANEHHSLQQKYTIGGQTSAQTTNLTKFSTPDSSMNKNKKKNVHMNSNLPLPFQDKNLDFDKMKMNSNVQSESLLSKLSCLKDKYGHLVSCSENKHKMTDTASGPKESNSENRVKFFVKGKLARLYPMLLPDQNSLLDFSFEPSIQYDATKGCGDDITNETLSSQSDFDENLTELFSLNTVVHKRKMRQPTFYKSNSISPEKEDKSDDEVNSSYLVKPESIPLDFLRDFVLNDKGQLNNGEMKRLKQKLNQPFAITSPSFNKATARAVMTTMVSDNATMVTISIANMKSNNLTATESVDSCNTVPSAKCENNRSGEEKTNGRTSDLDSTETSKLAIEETSIISKPKKNTFGENTSEGDDTDENELVDDGERTEINIRIDDSQLVQHGEQKRWQCHICEKSYTTKHNLVTHILDHNGIKPHLCMVCGKYFKQLSHLNTHMLTHDNIKPHICAICSKGFTQVSHLKRHQAIHTENRPYKCDICGRGFAFPSELRLHKEKHVTGAENKCAECGEDFDCQRSLKQHQVIHGNCQNLICKYCNKVFRYPSQLKDHLLSHEGTRPHICSECGMDFLKEHHLKAHYFTHSGKKPWSCPHCGRCFNQKANMQRHLLIHNAERNFKCDKCGKTFTQPQTLKAHLVVHAEQKPFECQFCGKQFGRLHNLQGHMHIHNNSKPYICFCGSSFTLKGNLNRHKKVKHGLNDATENLEEEAVCFLNELSDRTRPDSEEKSQREELSSDKTNTETEEEKDSDHSLDELMSPRKARKSIPRKYMYKRRSFSDNLIDDLIDENSESGCNDLKTANDTNEETLNKKSMRPRKRKRYEPERVYTSENETDNDLEYD